MWSFLNYDSTHGKNLHLKMRAGIARNNLRNSLLLYTKIKRNSLFATAFTKNALFNHSEFYTCVPVHVSITVRRVAPIKHDKNLQMTPRAQK